MARVRWELCSVDDVRGDEAPSRGISFQPRRADMIGEMLGSYRVVSLLGEGGMGVVYLAEHPLIGRKAAIKLLLPELTSNNEIVQRFFNEARASTLIKHPGIVDIFDFGHHPVTGSAYIVMEFLEGEALTDCLARLGRLPLDMIGGVGRQLARALGAAHAKGIIHRDLKPDNIFLVPDADLPAGLRVKILDFGIAKLTDATGSNTKAGAVFGTPKYMAPEQCRSSGEVDARSDVYALGCILFEMATGRPPFTVSGFGEIMGAHLFDAPPRLSELAPYVPPSLDSLVMAMLAKSPADRPRSMDVVADGLLPFCVGGTATPVAGVPIVVAAQPPATTTLGSAAGQAVATAATQPGASKSRRWQMVATTAVISVAVAGVLLVVRGRSRSSSSPSSASPSASQPLNAPVGTASPTRMMIPDAAVELARPVAAMDAGIAVLAAPAAQFPAAGTPKAATPKAATPTDRRTQPRHATTRSKMRPRRATKRKPKIKPITVRPAKPKPPTTPKPAPTPALRDEDEFTR